MKSDNDELQALRHLMALKRHEQPPPGYFNHLPEQIISRVQGAEGKPRFWEGLLSQFTIRPSFAYGFAVASFAALAVTVFYNGSVQPDQTAQSRSNNAWRAITSDEALAAQFHSSEPLHVASWAGNETASNPAPALPSLFAPTTRNSAIPVSFTSH